MVSCANKARSQSSQTKKETRMFCPNCQKPTAVRETVKAKEGVYRYRICNYCFKSCRSFETLFTGKIPQKLHKLKSVSEEKETKAGFNTSELLKVMK